MLISVSGSRVSKKARYKNINGYCCFELNEHYHEPKLCLPVSSDKKPGKIDSVSKYIIIIATA